ncbi:MAG: hypothetical protein KDI12_20180 [Anaerolineae bacterium]|nr:hypothetical protein [Anaerolineae bacterium]
MNSKQNRSRLPWLLMILALLTAFVLPASAVIAAEETAGVQFSGVIDAIAPEAWTVAGETLAITGDTVVVITTGNAAPGMWAEVRAVREDDDTLTARRINVMPPEMRLRGEATFIPDGRVGEWIIGGQPFLVDEDTRISDRGGPVIVGAWLQVAAVEEGSALKAVRIRAIEPLPHVEVMGAIQAFGDTSWTLSSIVLAADEDTLVQGEPQTGLLAMAAAELQPDNSLLMLRVRVMWQDRGATHPPVTLTGLIQQLPPHGLTGRWMVDGQQLAVSRNTLIDQRNGLAVVGAEVRVDGWQDGDVVVAREIIVISSPEPGLQRVHFTGPIRRLPDNGLLGLWMVDGRQVRVTEQTRIQGERFVRIGAMAQVWGLRNEEGQIVAATIEVHPPRPGDVIITPAAK